MNKIQIVLNSVFAVALVTLFILFFSSRKSSPAGEQTAAVVEQGNMPVAYINVDSLLQHYTFAQEAKERLMQKQENANLTFNKSLRTLQKEMNDHQQKMENHAYLSEQRARSEIQRLQNKQQELEELEAKLSQEFMLENQKINMQLADSLTTFLKVFNADGRFHIILSNTANDNVLMANEAYDITNQVIDGLNARCKK